MKYTIISVQHIKSNLKRGSLLVALSLLSVTGIVRAEEITISGNGSGSTSEAASSTTQTTTVQQNNNADINNTVQVTSNTGDNSASGNTNGDVAVTTGDTSTDVSIDNSANSSSVDTNCCNTAQSGQITITGNGTGSENGVAVTNTNTSTIDSNNTARITNSISGVANTGNNTSNDNTGGNISIQTGNISVYEKITNGPINSNTVHASSGTQSGYDIKINGNGSWSENLIDLDLSNDVDIRVHNVADILNRSLWILNTGNNNANDNTNGDVSINTGDISFISKIINGPINSNTVTVDCCDKEEEQPVGGPKPGEQATTPVNAVKTETKSSDSQPGSSGKGGEVLAAAIGKILPATGNYMTLLFLFGNIAMLFIGVFLRLRSGRSPGISYAL